MIMLHEYDRRSLFLLLYEGYTHGLRCLSFA